jgi:hypothetical protein
MAENNRLHIAWNVSNGTGEVDFINGVPSTGYEIGEQVWVYNKTTGATFSNANANEYMLSINPSQTYITTLRINKHDNRALGLMAGQE